MGAVKLNFRVARFGFVTGAVETVLPVDIISPLVLNVLEVPLEVENPRLDGDAGACDVCGR